MKNLFKFKYLPAFALVLAGGLAVGGELAFEDPNVYNANTGSGAPNWQPLEGETVNCDEANTRQCKAFRDENNNIVTSSIVYGNRQ